ncbi:MAG: hypothetical protein XU11_C0024G0030 [Candidatus Dadabacteria bacterium CSP1-2]|nr:MAG: hypothetical protein XU11_C0024G0030 [Candidatus Dadabacteria bacterium CSP1-2]
MLGLAFQNPDMMFFTYFEESRCPLCLKRTKSFFLVNLNFSLCIDCFRVFFVKGNTDIVYQ